MNRQLSSTKAGAQCDRLETVVSRTKLTVLATVDRLFDRRPWRVYYTKRHAASVFAQGGWMRKRVARVHLQQLIFASDHAYGLADIVEKTNDGPVHFTSTNM